MPPARTSPASPRSGCSRPRLFDTELAGRLLGYPRVALGTLVEEVLGYRFEKGHAAARLVHPPASAGLGPLRRAGCRAAARAARRPRRPARRRGQEGVGGRRSSRRSSPRRRCRRARIPWRRTSGMHRVHKPRQLAVVRELWETRDRIAERRDIAPGPDSPRRRDRRGRARPAGPRSRQLAERPRLRRAGDQAARRDLVQGGRGRARGPPAAVRDAAGTGPPPPRSWAARDAAAAARLAAAREAVLAIAAEHRLPAENLISPDVVRRLTWEPPTRDHRGLTSPPRLPPPVPASGRWRSSVAHSPRRSSSIRPRPPPGARRVVSLRARHRDPARHDSCRWTASRPKRCDAANCSGSGPAAAGRTPTRSTASAPRSPRGTPRRCRGCSFCDPKAR